jgi:DNA primase
MSRRFTDKQLYQVRNHIPIRHVIENLLAIESEMVDGVFRFRCPLCAGRHTAVKAETNLSRCFQCGKNFNAIDLCMVAGHMSFVESVKFLIERQERLPSADSKPACPKDVVGCQPKRKPLKRPVALHEILANLIGKGPCELSATTKKQALPASAATTDIAGLERIVHDLSQILQRLKAGCPSK